ncbi:hypothetical protein PHPALM_28000 [Phytophthora palmivora]|uniref:M96 mating-specific protein family n=1 Tax=Phytophthora palmivora TaxID=4796 RepID=A0A2P4XB71_9STRA|nr:hypothetical protein PHPALM_28000 [Phytophthora palmivora]
METRVEFLKLRQVKRRSIVQQQRNGLRRIKVLVDRELQRRRQAEHENAALKCHVRTCMRLCSAFRAAITTTLVSQASLNTVVPGSLHQLRISSTHTFNMLEKRVDRRFQAVQVILDEIQHTSVTLDEEQIQINSGNDEAATVMEYKCARVLPFDERSTSNAAWNIVEIGGVTQKQGSQVVRRSNDVYAVDSRFAVPLDHEELVMVDVHCVVKRFVVPEGVLLLAEANSDWFAHRGASALWDQQSHESIWCVVRGVPQEPALQSQPSKKKCQSWLRRKEELIALRRQTQELDTRVTFLKLQQEKRIMQLNLSLKAYARLKSWEAAAILEKERHQVAKVQNKELKNSVRINAQLLSSLQSAVVGASTLRTELGMGKQLRLGNSSIVDMLERRVDVSVSETNLSRRWKKSATTEFLEPSDRSYEISRIDLLPFKNDGASSVMQRLTTSGRFSGEDHRVW